MRFFKVLKNKYAAKRYFTREHYKGITWHPLESVEASTGWLLRFLHLSRKCEFVRVNYGSHYNVNFTKR